MCVHVRLQAGHGQLGAHSARPAMSSAKTNGELAERKKVVRKKVVRKKADPAEEGAAGAAAAEPGEPRQGAGLKLVGKKSAPADGPSPTPSTSAADAAEPGRLPKLKPVPKKVTGSECTHEVSLSKGVSAAFSAAPSLLLPLRTLSNQLNPDTDCVANDCLQFMCSHYMFPR